MATHTQSSTALSWNVYATNSVTRADKAGARRPAPGPLPGKPPAGAPALGLDAVVVDSVLTPGISRDAFREAESLENVLRIAASDPGALTLKLSTPDTVTS
mmetsp:Transcript_6271/g.14766  ORF Transcript_6271/g.14766 Transcript_6271/m.14766 type:complete len:101 (-) Transcript_6271:95-397(-)